MKQTLGWGLGSLTLERSVSFVKSKKMAILIRELIDNLLGKKQHSLVFLTSTRI